MKLVQNKVSPQTGIVCDILPPTTHFLCVHCKYFLYPYQGLTYSIDPRPRGRERDTRIHGRLYEHTKYGTPSMFSFMKEHGVVIRATGSLLRPQYLHQINARFEENEHDGEEEAHGRTELNGHRPECTPFPVTFEPLATVFGPAIFIAPCSCVRRTAHANHRGRRRRVPPPAQTSPSSPGASVPATGHRTCRLPVDTVSAVE